MVSPPHLCQRHCVLSAAAVCIFVFNTSSHPNLAITDMAAAGIGLVEDRADKDASSIDPALRRFRAGLELLALHHWRCKSTLDGEETENPVTLSDRAGALDDADKEAFVQLQYRHRWPLTFDTAARFVPRYRLSTFTALN